MRHFYINHKDIRDGSVTISGDEARHIARVIRLKRDDAVTLFDDDGTTYSGVIIEIRKGEVKINITGNEQIKDFLPHEIILAQAITKADKMDFIVQKSTELGITCIIPFFSLRSIPKWDSKKAEQKRDHWQKIAIASVKQSGIRKVPVIKSAVQFRDMITEDLEGFLKLILWEQESELLLRHKVPYLKTCRHVIFVVGPEGGFTEDEILLAKEHGFFAAGLGKSILRVETVSIAVLTILGYELGSLG